MNYPPIGGGVYPSQQPGYAPQQPGYAPQQPGFAPQQPGYAPQQPGFAPQQPGYAPQQPGYAPQQPGYAPQQPGYAPQQPGYAPQQPGYQQQQPPPGAMPMPGMQMPNAGPTYGMPQPGGPSYNLPPQSTFAGAAFAATAATNFMPSPHYGYNNNSANTAFAMGQSNAGFPTPSYAPPPQQRSAPSRPTTSPLHSSTSSQIPSEPPSQGTVQDAPSFNAQQDAEVLRKAMKGFGTDEKAITYVMGTRSNKQRQQIKLEFATMYGKDLIKELKSELSGNYEHAVLALLTPSDEFDASQLFGAMKGLGTVENTLIEILCTRSNSQIQAASSAFKRLYNKDLEKWLHSETSGHFRRLLISLVQGSRLESEPLSQQKAADDAQALYKAGEGRWGTDESRFNVVFASRSFAQLRLTFDEYKKISKKSMEQAIRSEMSGDLKEGMLAVVKCAQNRAKYFAEQLYLSMKGLGTDDKTLIRLMVSRSEIDMVQIKKEFQSMYGKTLGSYIADDCSGDYKKLLLQLSGR